MFLLLIASLAFLSIIWYKWRKRLMSELKRNGIPGPEPHLIFGNFDEFQTKGYKQCHEEWIKKYGRIVGYYLGAKPYVLIADPELLKDIQIKNFHQFAKRLLLIETGINPNPRLKNDLTTCEENRWKQMRSALTPTFSGSKLRQMLPIIDSTIDKFISKVQENANQNKEFDIYELFQGLTMDTIAKTCFGFDTGSQDSDEDAIIRAVKGTFDVTVEQKLVKLWLLFPELRFIVNPFRVLVEKTYDYFGHSDYGFLLKISDQLISRRRNDMSSVRKDLLQSMLEPESYEVLSNDKLSVSTDMSNDLIVASKVNGLKKIKMTDDEISSNIVLFFEAGYETTSSTLAYVLHILVNYTDVQQQLRQEVQQLLESEGKLDYNTVTKLRRMEAVIYETMRLYPPITTFISRQSKTDYPYKDLVLPKGVDCRVPLYYMHRDPELWTNPDVFDPDRFSDQNKHLVNPVIWQPFGVGPRNCIGMRFALLEIKLTLSKLLIGYKLVASENTELGDISREFKVVSMIPKNGIFVKAINISNK